MSRNVRNFWMTASIDGKERDLENGPRSADGGMTVDFLIRDNGQVAKSISVECKAHMSGLLEIVVKDENGHVVYSQERER